MSMQQEIATARRCVSGRLRKVKRLTKAIAKKREYRESAS